MQSDSDFLNSLSIDQGLLDTSFYKFVCYTYEKGLRRRPEFSEDEFDHQNLEFGDAWERCAFVFHLVISDEFKSVNDSYEGVLKAFLSIMGYESSIKFIMRRFMRIYLTIDDFYQDLESLISLIATNTKAMQRVDGKPPTSQEGQVIVDGFSKVDSRLAKVESDMRDLIWNVTDLRSIIARSRPEDNFDQKYMDMLLAIHAQIQLGAIK